MRFQCNNCMTVVAIEDTEMGQPVACGNCGKVVIVPGNPLAAGAVIGDFVIERHIGSGGLAAVYLVHQISLDQPAALKILHEGFAEDPEFIKNFIHEARAAAQLNHPNIVQAYAVGEENGTYYFAMEYVQGNTLKSVLAHSGRFVVEQALRITQEIAAALEFAWKNKQLVHRDIKPDNIIITEKQIVKLADLGLARGSDDILQNDSEEIFGTPQYVSPEQLLGYPADNRSDIYSLGATLFHLVTGTYPYTDETPAKTAYKHISETLPSPKSIVTDLPDPLCQLIQVMMAKRPGHRYQSATELLEDLTRVKNGERPSRSSLPSFAVPLDLKNLPAEMAATLEDAEQAAGGSVKQFQFSRRPQSPLGRGSAAPSFQTKSRKKLKKSTNQPLPGTQPTVSKTNLPSPSDKTAGDGPANSADGSSSRRLKFSGATSPRGTAGGSGRREVDYNRVRNPAKSGKKSRRRGLKRLTATLVVLALIGGGIGLAYYYFKFESGPRVETRFELDAEQTLRLRQLENEIENLSGPEKLTALRSALSQYRDKPETSQYLLTLATPLLEQQARQKRAERREAELSEWRERSRQLIAEEEERKARIEEEARQARLEDERREREQREAERREQRRQRLSEEQQRLRRQTVVLSRRHRFSQARIEYAAMAESSEAEFQEWARNQIKMLEKADQALHTFRNTGDKLAGMRFVPPDDFRPAQIISIDGTFVSAEFVEPVYEAGEKVGERKRPVTVAISDLPTRRTIRVIEEAWRYQNGQDDNELHLMIGAYLLARAEMLETAENHLNEARGELSQALLEELTAIRELARQSR